MVNSYESDISINSTVSEPEESFINVVIYKKDQLNQFPSPCNHPSQLKKKQGKSRTLQLSFPASKFPEKFLMNGLTGTLSDKSGRLHTDYASPTCHPSLIKTRRIFVVQG